jgi:hypothetical protein
MLSAAHVLAALVLLSVVALQTPSALVSPASAQSVATPKETPAKPDDGDAPDVDHVPAPELIALTWQVRRQFDNQRIKQPVWRPDGTRLTDAETIELLDKLKSFQGHWWQPDQLRPLVMVFRRDGAIESGLSAAVVLPDGRRLWSGTWGPFQPDRLAKSACAPTIRELAKWPEWVDLDVRVPLEDAQIVKTVEGAPDDPVEVAQGVRWYIDPDRGIDYKGKERREHLTAAVLELEDDSVDSLVVYSSTVWLRDAERPLSGGYVTKIGPRPNVWRTLRVSDPIDDLQAIERVEFTRQRFKMQRFAHIRLRVDLMPPPDTDESQVEEGVKKPKR